MDVGGSYAISVFSNGLGFVWKNGPLAERHRPDVAWWACWSSGCLTRAFVLGSG